MEYPRNLLVLAYAHQIMNDLVVQCLDEGRDLPVSWGNAEANFDVGSLGDTFIECWLQDRTYRYEFGRETSREEYYDEGKFDGAAGARTKAEIAADPRDGGPALRADARRLVDAWLRRASGDRRVYDVLEMDAADPHVGASIAAYAADRKADTVVVVDRATFESMREADHA